MANPGGGFAVARLDAGVSGLVFAVRAQSHLADARVFEAPAHLRAPVLRDRRLDAVAVRGAQLDALEPRGLAILDDGVDVPVLSELVGDKSQLEWRRRGRGSRAVRRGRAFSRRWARAAGCGL